MAATSGGSGGTVECKHTTTIISKLELEAELRKLQQMYETLNQEKSEYLQRMKDIEQKLRSSQDKNKKFLEKNMELTGINRKLKDDMENVCKENKKHKEQCDHSKKKIKQLKQQLNQEKVEKGTLEIQIQELEALKTQLSEQSKTVSTLKQNCEEKDRRIELIQHRKKKKRLQRLQDNKPQRTIGVKETYFGFDEDENSVDSETSFSSISHGTLSDEDLIDELSREEVEQNYQKLMKEHLELQKLHAILQTKAGSHLDPQRELKLRQQLEHDLFLSQCRLEQLEEECRKEKSKLNEQLKELDTENRKLSDDLMESQELVENLEFQIIELESQQVTGVPNDLRTLETIEEDPLEMMEVRDGGQMHLSSDGGDNSLSNKLKEAELHIHSLEQTAGELQNKISSLQQDKAKLKDELSRCRRESQEDGEVIQVLEVKKTPPDFDNCLPRDDVCCHDNTQNAAVCDQGGDDDDDKSSSPYVSMETESCDESDFDNSSCDLNDEEDPRKKEVPKISQSPSPKPERNDSPLPRSNRIHSPSPRPDGIRGDVFDMNIQMNTLLTELMKLQEENTTLKRHLHENNLIQEKYQNENNIAMETKIAEMNIMYENLQEKIYRYEMTDRQLRDKLKLAEHTINDLESSEGMLRDKLEDLQKSDTEVKRSLSAAEQKIHELKELNLDKDNVEQAIREKVQALEKADSMATQKISELEAHNHVLQQRLDLRDELEDDAELIENLQERLVDVQMENLELQKKINELEENERTLTNNWLKVADADANRLECLEQKVKMLESSNRELKSKIQEQQESTASGPSLAMELSEQSYDSLTDQSNELLLKKLNELEYELQRHKEEKAAAFEKFHEKMAIFKENEIKLSETIAEMENEEETLRTKLRLYESTKSSDSLRVYENKVKGLQSSQENLLERLDSMEEHEENLKDRLREVERTYGKKVYMLEKEIAEYIQHEEEMTSVIEEQEKHESELMEKVYFLEEEKLKIENENAELKEKVTNSLQREDDFKNELEKNKTKLNELQTLLTQKENELSSLIHAKEKLQLELEQSQTENGDLNEKLMEIQDSENSSELQNQIEGLQAENDRFDAKVLDLNKDRDKLKRENGELKERLEEFTVSKSKTNDQDSYVKELETDKVYLSENYDRVKTELERSHTEFTHLKKKISDLENSETRINEMEIQVRDFRAENSQLKNDLELIQGENNDLNERLIELDRSDQEKSSRCVELENKCEMLVEEECQLKNRIVELEESDHSSREHSSHENSSREQISVASDVEYVNQDCNTDISYIHCEHCDKYTDTNDLGQGQVCENDAEVESNSEENSDIQVSNSCELCDKCIDTSDLSDGQVKVTGLFGRVQELEQENAKLSEKLSSLEFSESHVKELSSKVKLLEETEDSLMERVMELEENEDKLKRELSKARASVDYVPELEDEIAELQESIKIYGEEKDTLECDMKESLRKSQEMESAISDLENQTEVMNKSIEKEKQKVESLLKGEERLLKSLSSEKSKNEDLQAELNALQDEMEEIKSNYDQKCVKFEEKEKELKSDINRISQEKGLLLQKLSDITNVDSETMSKTDTLLNQNTIENLIESVQSVPSHGAPDVVVSDIQSKCESPVRAEMIEMSNQSELVSSVSAETNIANSQSESDVSAELCDLRTKCAELEEKEYKHNLLIDELENRCLECEDNLKIQLHTDKYQKSKIHDLENLVQHLKKRLSKSKDVKSSKIISDNSKVSRSMSDDSIDQLLVDNMKVLEDNSNDNGSKVKDIEDHLRLLQEVTQDVVKDFVIKFGAETVAVETNTFPLIERLPANTDETFRQSLVNLTCCKVLLERKLSTLEDEKRQRLSDIRTKDDKIFELQNRVISLQSSDNELREKIKVLELSEKSLIQKVQKVHSGDKTTNVNQGNLFSSSVDKEGSDKLLVDSLKDHVRELEQSEQTLKQKVEYLESLSKSSTTTMLQEPEDILRQRIVELEKLEKHLKQQLSDLEHDRQELHDIARKDKSLIHDQNVKIRELQLSEKVLKEQANQYEIAEQDLYNKIRELEDQIEKMEDRIKELQILEMRLKELVHRYKLDEEVWLSKSENLVTSVTELSVSEANLKKTLEGMEKEKDGLSEKSQYLELRLKELENSESNLVQRVKDQENKETNLNVKIQELQVVGSNAELQLSELQAVNMDVTQRFNIAVQENAAMSHHIVQLQNQLEVLNQQVGALSESELHLKQEVESSRNKEKELHNQMKESQLGDMDTQGKLRQLEEQEIILKDKVSNLQRSENRLKYRVQELESSDSQMPVELTKSQKEKLPRKLEDCQRRIVVLQKQNDELASSLKDYQNLSASESVIRMPQSEYNKIQAKLAVLEQTENQMDEVERLNAHLQDTVSQLRQGKNVCGHEVELDVLRKRLEQSNASVTTLKQLAGSADREDMGPMLYRDAAVNQRPVSQIETPGHLAERPMNGNIAQFSRPIHGLANNLGNQSDASTAEEETFTKTVQRGSHMTPNDDRRRLINDLVSHLDISDSDRSMEEDHWRTVESQKIGSVVPQKDGWISVGKATSLHSSKDKMSRHKDEELVLGLTLPSETESQIFTQNDTDSNMSSPVMKRRKFRPTESTDSLGPPPPLPHSMPPSLQSRITDSFATTSYNAPSSILDSGDEVQNNAEDYGKNQRPSRSQGFGAVSLESGIDSGRGTASVSSAPKRPTLHERIEHISQTLQNKPTSRSETTEDEDSTFVWRTRASEASRLLETTDKENKNLKDEINRLEKDLEDKCRYILILETFIEKLHQLLQNQETKSDREIIQILEAEMEKLKVEISESGNRKLEISQDPVALTTQLNKKDRDLALKKNEVDGLMKELKQWQDECRTIEDMRTNALDSIKCLQMEVTELQDAENQLKESKEAYNKMKSKYKTLQETVKALGVIESERFDLEQEVKVLRQKVKVIPELESEYSLLEGRLEETCKVLDDRGTKVNDLLNEITEVRRRIISLEQEKVELQKDVDGYQSLQSRCKEAEHTKNSALASVAPLKAKIKRLCQKCKEKDELLRRLGIELRKINGAGKPITVLDELRRLEVLMAGEEYNVDGDTGSPTLSPRVHPNISDIGRSASPSSVSDSDSDVQRPRLSDQDDRHQRPLHSNNRRAHLPQIYTSETSPTYRGGVMKKSNKDGTSQSPNQRSPHDQLAQSPKSPTSYSQLKNLPPNTLCVAVADYNPELFSQSGRQRLELSLTEGDQVRVTGPLDQNGYYEAEVNGRVGLVPSSYLHPLPPSGNINGHLSLRERRINQLQQSPSHLDSSPEKILLMHHQLQQSTQTQRKKSNQSSSQVNGHLNDSLSPRSPREISSNGHHPTPPPRRNRNKTVPDSPTNFHIERTTGDHSILVTWTPPSINELGRNNGLQVTGYKFYINGKSHQQINNPHATKAAIDNIYITNEMRIGIQTLTTVGKSSIVMETIYNGASSVSDMESDVDTDLETILKSQQYKTGQKKVFLGVYDYDPAQQSPQEYKNCELSFEAGEVITVYGKERLDGFYYAEINGKRGLVPASFIEEVPVKLPVSKQGSTTQKSGGVNTGQRKVKQSSR